MSLQVWLPLTRDVRQQGLSDVTMSGSPASWTDGKLGKAATWNGNVANCVYNNTSDFNYTNNFSVAVWYKHKFTSGATQYAFTVGRADAGGYGYGLQSTAATQAYFRFGSVAYPINDLVQDIWYHLVMTVGNNRVIIYKNGVQVSSNNMPGTLPTYSDGNGLGLGCFHYGSNIYPFYGSLNDFRIYNHCLSAEEVKRISQGLACHYNLSDGNIESTYNYLENKSFSNYGSYGFGSKGTISVTTEVEPPIAGNEVALVASSATTAGNSAVEIATSIYPGTIMNKDETFTVTAYIKGKGATIGKRAHIHLYNTNGTNTQSTGKDYTFTNEWQRIEYTLKWNYDTPSNSSLNCYVVGYIASQEQFYVSSVQVEKKDHSTPFTPNTRTSTTIYDTSGYCNNGTITGDLTTSTDTPKYQASIHMPTAATISHSRCLDNTSQEWTCAAWVKPDAAGNYQNLNNFNESNRLYHGTYPLLYLNSGTNDYYNYGNLALPANQWSHIVFVFKNSTGTKLIYVNGENRTNTGGPNKTSTPKGIPDTVIIGGSFAGYMCDYREYATALSASDVKSLYQNCATIGADGKIYGQIRA